MTTHTTTLRRIRAAGPCEDGWEELLRHLGKTEADDERLAFSTIVESNGINDAIWCMQTLDDPRLIGTIAGRIALRVVHIYEAKHPNDDRVRYAAELTASGVGTPEELRVAAEAANAAARGAAVAYAASFVGHAAAYAAHAAANAADAAAFAADAAANASDDAADAAADAAANAAANAADAAADAAANAADDASYAAGAAAERAAQAQIIRETLG